MFQPAWMGAYGSMLLTRHAKLISRNLTTNEGINYRKYAYLKHPTTGRYHNPFNRGRLSNWIHFFGCVGGGGAQ